jgi:type 2A phosphatase activator TIP41
VSPRLQEYAKPLKWDGSLVGVSIAGFDIGTSQGPIADSSWYTEHGRKFEKKAQYAATNKQGGKRKLCLPEMIFPVAHVALEGHGLWMSWDASDCLEQWALQHAQIPVGSDQEHCGVSVLKAQDAKLWQKRSHEAHKHKSSKDAVFHYDWTFSSPFAAKVEGGNWIELDESGMRMALLTDQTVPILFFDEIVLYEDDLHDNGQVQYTIKLRIMPSCAYILARLWVRVDNVLVRVRETRVLIDFFGIQPQIFRDVTWRECLWKDLESHGLPSSLRDWNCETGGETAEWNQLLSSIPTVDLPKGILAHATLEYGISEHDDDEDKEDQDASMTLL